jgi:hypothetical protein
MPREPYTGGPLNKLNGDMGISAPGNSVPVNALVKEHNPKSAAELEQLIADHVGGGCECGIVSQGKVEDFGRNLYEAQQEYWGEYRFTLDDCIQWEYDLFVLQMLKGRLMEDKCKQVLSERLGSEYTFEDTSNYIDEELRVDLEVLHFGEPIAGIQVKPTSFEGVRRNVQVYNRAANEKYDEQVLYVKYQYDSEEFTNLDKVVNEVRKLSE